MARAKKKKGSPWVSKESSSGSALTANSYQHYVLRPLADMGHKDAAQRRSPRHPVRVVHDKDPTHAAKSTSVFAANHHMELIELPARAPDLDPLDYGVFGGVKLEWMRRVSKEALTWEAQCDLLIELLQKADATAAIKALPSRIQKCIDIKGAHFEK